jgi:hypothetical protein
MSSDPIDLNAPLREMVEIKSHLIVIERSLSNIYELLDEQVALMRGVERYKVDATGAIVSKTTNTTTSKATKTAKPAAKTK